MLVFGLLAAISVVGFVAGLKMALWWFCWVVFLCQPRACNVVCGATVKWRIFVLIGSKIYIKEYLVNNRTTAILYGGFLFLCYTSSNVKEGFYSFLK